MTDTLSSAAGPTPFARWVASGGVADGEAQVDEIVEVLRRGGVVVLPTDTVYGLAARPSDAAAVDRLFLLKGRRADVPIAVLCASREQALALADPVDGIDAVAARFWPGPLTVVLPRRTGIELHLGEPRDTIGLRVPAHPLVQAVARAVGPIAVTSANRHGRPTPATASAAAAELTAAPDLVVDAGRLDSTASTVIAATTTPWTVLRVGSLDPATVLAAAGQPVDARPDGPAA
jgi:L-threonylcarbamoyladenylate synthase